MDNAMSISNPQNNHQFPTEQTLNLGINVDGAQSVAPTSEEPAKRRPGRPKGSTKKNLLGTALPQAPKLKRPVGRPRKDGMPAGSVGPTRTKRERQAAHPNFFVPTAPDGNFQGVAYPPALVYPTSVPQFMPAPVIQIDPSLTGDEWATLSRSDPNSFLSILLAALAAPNPVSTAGPSVEEAFKAHLISLAPTPNQVQPIPSLYSILKTFWLPSSPAYFSLTASASTARTPSEHRFLYWDPLPLVFNGIGCPNCGTPLLNKGRISTGPVKIYDIEKPFFVIGCEYICRSPQCVNQTTPEGRKFASTDSSILRSLPPKLRDEFPAKLLYDSTDAGSGPNIWNWKALGVSWSLWNMVIGALRVGLKSDVILHLIQSVQHGVGAAEDLKSEEEESEDGNQVNDQSQEQQPEPTSVAPQSIENRETPSFPDAYSNAWKENTAVTDSTVKSPVPSTSQAAPPTPSTIPPQSQPFPYHPYPFAPYAYMAVSGQMVPLASPPHASASSVSAQNHTGVSDGVDVPTSQQPPQEGHSSKRSPRHCCKCGSQDCKGKGGRTFCMNACQDCGKLDCKGRNSRRPDKKCSEGWT